MSKDVFDYSTKLADGGRSSGLKEVDSQVCPGTYTEGEVLTPLGYVIVYAQGSYPGAVLTRIPENPFTVFRFAYEGMLYTRKINKRLSLRGITIMAYKFVKETAKKKG